MQTPRGGKRKALHFVTDGAGDVLQNPRLSDLSIVDLTLKHF